MYDLLVDVVILWVVFLSIEVHIRLKNADYNFKITRENFKELKSYIEELESKIK